MRRDADHVELVEGIGEGRYETNLVRWNLQRVQTNFGC